MPRGGSLLSPPGHQLPGQRLDHGGIVVMYNTCFIRKPRENASFIRKPREKYAKTISWCRRELIMLDFEVIRAFAVQLQARFVD